MTVNFRFAQQLWPAYLVAIDRTQAFQEDTGSFILLQVLS